MASSATVQKTKITETFTLVDDNGETHKVEEHTRYEIKKVNGEKQEILGRAFLLTDAGRGVLKNIKDGSYSIPSLSVKAIRS
jgi:hypothetical protein